MKGIERRGRIEWRQQRGRGGKLFDPYTKLFDLRYSTVASVAMRMSPSNTSSLRRPMRLLSTVTQQLLGLRKQSTYRPRVLNSIDSLFTSSTWVHSYKTQQERREPFPARTVSPDTSWKILEHLNHILISKWVSMWKASSGDTRKLPCEAAMGSKPKSDFTYTLQTQ